MIPLRMSMKRKPGRREWMMPMTPMKWISALRIQCGVCTGILSINVRLTGPLIRFSQS